MLRDKLVQELTTTVFFSSSARTSINVDLPCAEENCSELKFIPERNQGHPLGENVVAAQCVSISLSIRGNLLNEKFQITLLSDDVKPAMRTHTSYAKFMQFWKILLIIYRVLLALHEHGPSCDRMRQTSWRPRFQHGEVIGCMHPCNRARLLLTT